MVHIKKVKNIFDKNPPSKFSNEWKTSKYMFKQVGLHAIIGCRGSGKSYICSKMLRAGNSENLYDRIFFITPSYLSNKKQFDDLGVDAEDVYEPEVNAIDKVIEQVEAERDEWEQYLSEMEIYNKMTGKETNFDDDELLNIELLLNGEEMIKPQWKRKIVRRPQCVLILDDIIGSPCMRQASGINKIATLNRHIAPLQDGGALGLSVIILAQTYSTTNGHSISRLVRENLTTLTLFSNKQEKQFDKIVEETGGTLEESELREAYKYAIKEPHDNLTIDFNPKCETMRYRRNLNEFIIFDRAKNLCKCKKN
jgi:hypothetical protein